MRWLTIIVCGLISGLLLSGQFGPHPNSARAAEPVRIGVLTEAWGPNAQVVGLRDGLQKLGYRDGVDFVIGVRFTQGNVEALFPAARELVAQGVDILFTGGGMPAQAAKAATSIIPIVFAGASDDPVARGLVRSINRPGGNITGVIDLGNELAGKRLEYFWRIVPGLKRVLVAYAANNPWGTTEARAYRDAAHALGVTLIEKPFWDQAEAQANFTAIRTGEVQGLLVSHALTLNVPGFAIEAGARLRIPSMFPAAQYVEQGGLASYGPDLVATGRQAARLVDKVIKGQSPSEIPVESNPRIELTVNLTVARSLGLRIPVEILDRADRLFQ